MTLLERIRETQRLACEREQRIVADNAYWAARAAETREREKAAKAANNRARAELVRYLMEPGNVSEMLIAHSTINAPILAKGGNLPTHICWMPKGTHEISAGLQGGGCWQGTVNCDEASARAVEASFLELTQEGWRSFIDFDHRDAEAAAWVHGFSWKSGVGILCAVEWTPAGEEAIRGKVFTSFSPAFLVSESGRVSGLTRNAAAGALTNRPAFGLAMPPITAAGRSAAACLMHETALSAGLPADDADRISEAVGAGHDPRAIALLIETLSRKRS